MPAPFELPHQRFDHEPGPDELGALLGERFFMDAVDLRDDEDTLSLRLPRLPMRSIAAFLCVFVLALAFVPVFRPDWLPAHTPRGAALGAVAAVAFLIAPAFFGVLFALNRKATSTPPGVVVDKRARTLVLPRADVTVPYEEVAFATELRRWDEVRGTRDKVTQWGVVVRDGAGYVHHPIGHFLGKLIGRSPAAALADALEVRLERTNLDRAESEAVDASPA